MEADVTENKLQDVTPWFLRPGTNVQNYDSRVKKESRLQHFRWLKSVCLCLILKWLQIEKKYNRIQLVHWVNSAIFHLSMYLPLCIVSKMEVSLVLPAGCMDI